MAEVCPILHQNPKSLFSDMLSIITNPISITEIALSHIQDLTLGPSGLPELHTAHPKPSGCHPLPQTVHHITHLGVIPNLAKGALKSTLNDLVKDGKL